MTPFKLGFVALVAATGSLIATGAQATTRLVTANGTDSMSCGTATNSCRSITQAIANAVAGDTIKVGPGLYGDLNGDDALGGTGEEIGGCGGGCMIELTKAVSVVSTNGAGATIIRAPAVLSLNAVVALTTSGAALGKPGKGFTISGGVLEQVFGFVPNLKVMGNRLLPGSATYGVVLNPADNAVVRANVVPCSAATTAGIYVVGANAQILSNVVSSCIQGFLVLSSNWTMTGNVATDNDTGVGFDVTVGVYDPPLKFAKNEVIGNGIGINISTGDNPPAGTTVNLATGNAYGNGASGGNCGVRVINSDMTAPITVNFDKFFWGAPAGPGSDPADQTCSVDAGGGVNLSPTNNALKPNSIKAPPQR